MLKSKTALLRLKVPQVAPDGFKAMKLFFIILMKYALIAYLHHIKSVLIAYFADILE